MKKTFGALASGQEASLYTISCGKLSAEISDYGATLVRLFVPDQQGNLADVVLGFDDPNLYTASHTFFGATVGRNANRLKNASFTINGKVYNMTPNDDCNNLHSGPDYYKDRIWTVVEHTESSIQLRLDSPDGDQGFPGNAVVHVSYILEPDCGIKIVYDAVSDQDTIFNMTNHTYFNLAGHDKPELAMQQELAMPARFYNPDDALSIPTGELCPVEGTPMDFRTPKAIGRDIEQDYFALKLQGGYDHNFEVYTNPCAILRDPVSGRTMEVFTDCPGVQFYSGNYTDEPQGKDGVSYGFRSGICLETQFYPDATNHPEWPQPITRAGEHYHTETKYTFR